MTQLKSEIVLLERENSILSEAHKELFASTAECEGDLYREQQDRTDEGADVLLVIERMKYENNQLLDEKEGIRQIGQSDAKHKRLLVNAFREENRVLRELYV